MLWFSWHLRVKAIFWLMTQILVEYFLLCAPLQCCSMNRMWRTCCRGVALVLISNPATALNTWRASLSLTVSETCLCARSSSQIHGAVTTVWKHNKHEKQPVCCWIECVIASMLSKTSRKLLWNGHRLEAQITCCGLWTLHSYCRETTTLTTCISCLTQKPWSWKPYLVAFPNHNQGALHA